MVDGEFNRKQALFSLLRSKDRSIVLLYSKTVNDFRLVKQISKATGVDYSNVVGALIGNGKRFKKERSLVYTGMMLREELADGAVRFYKITKFGIKCATILEDLMHVVPVLDEDTGKFSLEKKDK